MNGSNAPSGIESRMVRVGSRLINLAECGSGAPVLMLHGGGPGASGLSNYSRNIAALAQNFRVLVPDMPGYGQSTKGVDAADPFGDLATAMFGLLDALDIEKAHVIGNSLGGACALRMALEQPERIDRMVLMGPGGIGLSRTGPTDGLKRLLGYYAGTGPTREKLREFILQDLVHDASQVPESLIDERYRLSIDPEVVANPPLPGPVADPRKIDLLLDPRLAQIRIPALALWGTEDKVNPASGGALLQEHMALCDLYLFSRTGHWVQWERADEFNAVATTFLAQRTQHEERRRPA